MQLPCYRGVLASIVFVTVVACASSAPHSPTAPPPASPSRPTSTLASTTPSSAPDPNSTELATLRANLNATDVELTLRDEPDPVQLGAELRYIATLSNIGPNPATSTQLTLMLPTGVQYLRDDASCRMDARMLVCELGEILAREQRTVTVVVTAARGGDATVRAQILNRAGPDLDVSDNAAIEQTTIAAP